MKKILLTFIVALPLLATSLASADPAPTGRKLSKEDREDCARVRGGDSDKPCFMDFSKGDDIDGDKKVPTGSDVDVIMGALFGNLIHYRADFRPEIIRTAERF